MASRSLNDYNDGSETSPLLQHVSDQGPKNVHEAASFFWKEWLPRLNFYRIHLAYFWVTIIIGSIIIYGIDQGLEKDVNRKNLSWADALFLATSAMTLTGRRHSPRNG